MLFFFDRYTENVGKLQETMHCLGQEVQIAVLQDNGFLPVGVSSPYEFFTYRNRQEELAEKDLFYNFIELPDFKEPAEKRNVQRVEWHMENGWVYKIDYYNRYGLKYASEFLDTDRNVEAKVFYSDKNQEIVVEQPVNRMISLLEKGTVRNMFDSYDDFIDQYLKEAGFADECILFVQDEKTFELLSLSSQAGNKWTYILFSDDDLLNKYIGMGGKNGGRFYAIPESYRENHARSKALILTASDRIEKL